MNYVSSAAKIAKNHIFDGNLGIYSETGCGKSLKCAVSVKEMIPFSICRIIRRLMIL